MVAVVAVAAEVTAEVAEDIVAAAEVAVVAVAEEDNTILLPDGK